MEDVASQRRAYDLNVKKVLGVYFLSVATREVSFGALFDAYLMKLGGDSGNVLVGTVESVRGLLQMILSYPLGMMADKYPRVRVSQYNMPFFTLGFILLMAGIWHDNTYLIMGGMAIWAPTMQCWFSTSSAIVADSCLPETRTTTIAFMSNVQLIGGASGPLLQVICLFGLGIDSWNIPLLHRVLAIGCLIWPFVILGTFTFKELPPMEKTAAKGRSRFLTSDLDKPLLGGVTTRWWLAIALQVSTTVTSIGAGMTVKFFPLFFIQEYGFTPRDLCLLSFCYPLSMAAMQRVSLAASQKLGRLEASLLFHILGTATLFLLCVAKPLYLALPLYFLRGALMNAKQPITTAITMDLVTSEMRGRWSSIQSIAGFSWSGSAFIGGWVAQSSGYRASFAVTAIVYTISGLMLLPLFKIFPNEVEQKALHQKVTPKPTPRAFPTPCSQSGTLADAGIPLLEEAIECEVERMEGKDKTQTSGS